MDTHRDVCVHEREGGREGGREGEMEGGGGGERERWHLQVL